MPRLITVWEGGFPFDLMVEDAGAPTTLVSLHAALGSSGLQPPVFTARAVLEGIGVNRIFVSDPGLYASPDLGLAWYLGTDSVDATAVLAEIIAQVQRKLGARHLVFFGMSGGGFAALNLGHEFPGSLAVPVNPQTRILNYAPVHWAAMAKSCLGAATNEEAAAVLEAHPRADMRRLYPSSTIDNSVIYVQNLQDAHVSSHMIPWLDSVGWPEEGTSVLMKDWGAGHRPPPGHELREMLSSVAQVDGDWGALARIWGANPQPTREWVRSVSGR
ncbi:MAG: hypothetical protein Q4F65_01480 [Propionibacteriaceae bacterium]|nr:hypothetical protein [Propionibacteriaceae bacterium]